MNDGGLIPNLRWINSSFNYIQFNNIGPDYRDMLPNNFSYSINWINIYNSFQNLFNINQNIAENTIPYDEISQSLFTVILVTSEILRFRNLTDVINNEIIIRNETILVSRNRNDRIYHTLVMWGNETRNVLNTMRELIRNSTSIRRNRNFLLNVPVDNIPEILREPRIRILIGYMWIPNINFSCNNNCNNIITVNINCWSDYDKFCSFKSQIDKFQGNITTIAVLDENNKGNLKVGDFYIGTTKQLCLIHDNGMVYKADNIKKEVTSIKNFSKDKFFMTTKEEKVYLIKTDSLKNGLFFLSKIDNFKSSNLNKELKLFYDYSEKNFQFEIDTKEDNPKWKIQILNLNLNEINPVDNYEKIEFLGDVYSDGWATRTTWRDNYDNSTDLNNCLNYQKELSNFILNKKIDNNDWSSKQYLNCILQNIHDEGFFFSSVSSEQRFGLTWYWENKNYYLQSVIFQYGETWKSGFYNVYVSVKVGSGIRLYNDNTNSRKRREIFDINNLEEKNSKKIISNELQNITKWTDDFTKSINNEQHLPTITNNSNYTTSL